MKKKIIIASFLSAVAFTTQSCKKSKAGCLDPLAENYGKYVKLDDGSCMYHSSSQITLTNGNWTFADPYYRATITWASLTKEVIDRESYSVFLLDGNSWVELPIAYSVDATYSSYFQANVSEGQVVISSYDSDLTQQIAPPSNLTIKVVASW